ncbi:BQ5605_C011g06495 [Microbotryum silenes-dioicae]|uniref:BQ5605_C011g06495 protein n=1 Tax=Microbotryum silenes-dioicae TaxID=796604 RepID=A0A2X0M9X8_9BASI|nr:BQ5605_C011g06495 [Microbotryum silenes-dioicae]
MKAGTSTSPTPSSTEPSKRGRKRKADQDIEGDEETAKRKLQNRAAQRSFRERKERHMQEIEVEVQRQATQLARQTQLIDMLIAENKALRLGQPVPETAMEQLDTGTAAPSASSPTLSPHDSQSSKSAKAQQQPSVENLRLPHVAEDVKPQLVLHPPPPSALPPTMNYATSTPPMALPSAPYPLPVRPQPQSGNSLEDLASYAMASIDPELAALPTCSAQRPAMPIAPGGMVVSLKKPIDVAFDFETPFEYEDLPMPDLYQSFFDPAFFTLPPETVANTETSSTVPDLDRDSTADLDDPECDRGTPPPLPNGRLPCNKPECDFSQMSCALPAPWRPASLSNQVDVKDVWVCQTAWAKLCSHPLFEECDVDALCHELRSRTKCSNEGQLVIQKEDVCQVFRSIPARAKMRRRELAALKGEEERVKA